MPYNLIKLNFFLAKRKEYERASKRVLYDRVEAKQIIIKTYLS
jgi:hypothetical protein